MKKQILIILMLTMCSNIIFSQVITTENLDSILCEVHDKDQSIRMNFSMGNKVSQEEDYSEKLHKIDNENLQIVSSILDSIGWPENLSYKANLGIFLVIDHSPKAIIKKYLSLVEEQANKGIISRDLYATLYDRFLMKEGKKQIYGTQTFTLPDENGGFKILLWPVKDSERIDSLREEIGLKPISEYLIQIEEAFGQVCIWDQNLTLQDIPKYYFDM